VADIAIEGEGGGLYSDKFARKAKK